MPRVLSVHEARRRAYRKLRLERHNWAVHVDKASFDAFRARLRYKRDASQ